MHDAVLALLADLQIGEWGSLVIHDQTHALVEEICQRLTQLEITGIRMSQDGDSGLNTITANALNGDIVLARLTSSECIGSASELAAHLLLLLDLHVS
jgi:hypothetical protein